MSTTNDSNPTNNIKLRNDLLAEHEEYKKQIDSQENDKPKLVQVIESFWCTRQKTTSEEDSAHASFQENMAKFFHNHQFRHKHFEEFTEYLKPFKYKPTSNEFFSQSLDNIDDDDREKIDIKTTYGASTIFFYIYAFAYFLASDIDFYNDGYVNTRAFELKISAIARTFEISNKLF